jgi:hypothetical protein
LPAHLISKSFPPKLWHHPALTAYIGFLLKPNSFFDQNQPANDVPPSKPAGASKSCCHD